MWGMSPPVFAAKNWWVFWPLDMHVGATKKEVTPPSPAAANPATVHHCHPEHGTSHLRLCLTVISIALRYLSACFQ